MDQIRITNPSQFRTALQALLIADQPNIWVSLRQQDNLTLTYMESDSDGFEGLAVRMAEDVCIHAFLLVKSTQFKVGSQTWVHTNIRPSHQCGIVQLCFVGTDSGVTRAAAHRAHHFRGLTAAVGNIAFGLISDNVFDLSALLDKVTKDKVFHPPTYMTVVPNKGFFTLLGSPQSPFPISLSSFVNTYPSVRINVDSLSATGLLADAFKVVSEIRHENHRVREHRRNRIPQFNSSERQPPKLLPQIDQATHNAETNGNSQYNNIHSPTLARESPPVPPPRALENRRTKFNSTLQQPGNHSKGSVILKTLHKGSTQTLLNTSEEAYPSAGSGVQSDQSCTPQATGLKSKEYQITHLNSVLMSDTSYLDNLDLPSSSTVVQSDKIASTLETETQVSECTPMGAENAVPAPFIKDLAHRPVRPRSLLIRRFTQTDNRLKESEDDFGAVRPSKHERSYSSSSLVQVNDPTTHHSLSPGKEQQLTERLVQLDYEGLHASSYSQKQERKPSRSNATDIRSILSRPSSVANIIPEEVDLMMEKISKIYVASPFLAKKDAVDNSEIFISHHLSDIPLSPCLPNSEGSIDATDLFNLETQPNLKDLEIIISPSVSSMKHSLQKPPPITSYKPALNQLSLDIATFSRSCELNPQLQNALTSLQTAVFDTVSAINHEFDPEHKSICIFEERIGGGSQSHSPTPSKSSSSGSHRNLKKMEDSILTLRDRLIRVAMTLVVNIGTDKGLVYGDVSHMINAVSIYLPRGGLQILRNIILNPLPLDISVLVNEGLNLIEFCNKI